MDHLYVGIDIGLEHNVVVIMDSSGRKVAQFTAANDLEGTSAIETKVASLASDVQVPSLTIGMEATGMYHWHVYHKLCSSDTLAPFKPKIGVMSPKVVDGFKRTYTDIPKTDRVDAYVIADCLRFGRVPLHPPQDPRYSSLQRLTRARFRLAQSLTREKNRALDLLYLRFSNYASGCPFSNVFGKASEAVFSSMTPDEIAHVPIEDLVELIMAKSNHRIKDPDQVASELKMLAKNAYRLNPKMDDSVRIALMISMDSIRFFEQQLKRIDAVISRDIKGLANTLETIPGIGPVYAAGILAEVGDINRFDDHNALAKFAGLTWRQHQSSKYMAEDIPLSRLGNFYLRYYLVEAANSVRVREPEYNAFYQRKYEEATHHRHKRALVLTARKLIRMVFVLLSEGQIYNREKARR